MFLSSLCSDFKSSCEKAYEQIIAIATNPASPPRVTSAATRGEYEKLRKDDGGDNVVREPETMDREMAHELVELAVSGVEYNKLEKTKRPGGETFSVPPINSASRSVASQNLKELNSSASTSETAHIEFCREMENRTFVRLKVIRDEQAALQMDEPFFLVDMDWYDQWVNFLNGEQRPGPIQNASVDKDNGELGRTFVGLDAKGWGVLSDLYTYDVAVMKEY